MIKFVIFDFDGIFTDGKCYFDQENIIKYYNVKDGMAIKILRDHNLISGLISSYNSEKDVFLNKNKIDQEIMNHLKFDYKFIGKANKIDILDNWLKDLNLDYNNVAYIGDDINDIEVMKRVCFSSCPYDAVSECKKIVNYICKKKGGDGCVREFVDKIINFSKEFSIIDEIRNEFYYQIDNFNLDNINELADIIQNIEGNIYFCGVGKSGNIAKHCCDLLKCISYKSFYFDILNSTHGNIGTIKNNDIILLFSNSGNTSEIINIIPLLKKIDIKIIGICCNKQSKFKELCDLTIITPFNKEISGEINQIPTNSYMSHLLFCNILVSILKNNISIDQYKENHLSGNIGTNLLKIKDVIITEYPKIIMNSNESIELNKVLLEMTKYKIGCCFFVNNENKLFGILTDGDIRRLILKNKIQFVTINKIQFVTINNINTKFKYEIDIDKYLFELNYNNIYIPIMNDEKLIGIFYK